MGKYIDKLSNYKLLKLLEKMKIKSSENIITSCEISAYNGKVHVYHGKSESGEDVESVYDDYLIEKLYGCVPSDYDQIRYQYIMKEIAPKEYSDDCELFNELHGFEYSAVYNLNSCDEDEEEYEEE